MKIHPYRWGIEFQRGWKVVALNLHPLRWQFGFWYTWYDGPHHALGLGPFNVYWNWGKARAEESQGR